MLAAMNAPPVWPSPCVGICVMDGDVCSGCGRTTSEIVAWRDGPERLHAEAWQALPDRQARIGMMMRPLPWHGDHLDRFLAASVSQNVGTWVTGVSGALAEFFVPPGERAETGPETTGVTTAHYGPHSLSLWVPEKARPLPCRSHRMMIASPPCWLPCRTAGSPCRSTPD